jgi:cyclic dehypoxanthinyl futalosine synthase
MPGRPRWEETLADLESGRRPDAGGWLALADGAPDEALRAAADRRRAALHPDGRVGYVLDRNINYTNVCSAVCTFCAFYRRPGSADGYVLLFERIFRKVEEALELGASGVLMQGGLHPDLPLSWYEGLLFELKSRYSIYLHCFSPPEIWHLARVAGVPLARVLERLREAGLDSIPGGGAEILVDEIRTRRATKCTGPQWIETCEVAHRLGIPTTATMMFGIGETDRQRIEHLEMLRGLQERTGGILAFIPWTFQPDNTALGRTIPERVPPAVYLRWLALCRLYLDNVANIQVSWLTQGLAAGRRGLRWGANDIGSVMIEENVITPAGAHHRAVEADLVGAIREAGFSPVKRNAGYVRLEDEDRGGLLVPRSSLPAGPRPVMAPVRCATAGPA